MTAIACLGEKIYARDLVANYALEGNLDDRATIPEINTIATNLGVNVESTEKYLVTGTVVATPQETYGNTTIEDADGNQLYIYGVYDESGNRYDQITDKFAVGDTITLYGIVVNYQKNADTDPKIEMKNAVLISIE